MTIPHWPKRSPRGSRPWPEVSAERKFFRHSTELYNQASASVRSTLYRNGEPMVCISCGAKTNESGGLPCGH
jgi:hypothetical protein